MSDLIERLREGCVWQNELMPWLDETATEELMDEAADYITTLEAKLVVAREALEDLCAEKHGARPRALRALKEIEQ